jgi:hypothetical protein
MADNFDAEQIIYDMIKNVGVAVFQDRPRRDRSGEYIVIRSNGCNYGEIVNIPQVNVNIFVPRTADGMVNRDRIEAIRTLIYNAISSADDPEGYYCIIDQSFSNLLEDVREGYDCFTIRYELTLNT